MDLFCRFSHAIGSAILLLSLLLVSTPTALAGSVYTWQGGGVSNNWNDTFGNWDLANYPGFPGSIVTDDSAIFPQSSQNYTVNNGQPITIDSMTFQGNYTFTNTGLFILRSSSNNSGINTGATNTIINNAKQLIFKLNASANDANLTNQANADFIDFQDSSNASNSNITNNATVNFQNSSSAATASISNNNNSNLNFADTSTANQASITNNGTVNFNNSASAGSSTITNNTNKSLNFNDSSTANQATINNNGNTNFKNTASAGSANITNNQMLSFNDTSTANQASISNLGSLSFNNSATAGQATITNNGNINFNNSANAGTATISNNLTLNFNATSTANQANIANQGTLNFNNSANAATATITNTGALYFNNSATANQAIINNSGGTINVPGAINTPTLLTIGSLTDSSNATGSVVLGNASVLSLGANNNVNDSLFGVVSGNGSLIKLGSGILALSGQNTYTGSTDVQVGSLVLDSNGQLGSGNTSVTAGATLDFINSANAHTSAISNSGNLIFANSSTANQTTITNNGTGNFNNSATAGSSTITNNNNKFLSFNDSTTASQAIISNNGNLSFKNTASAGNANITNNQTLSFNDSATANQAGITNHGNMGFNNSASAANSTITNYQTLSFNNSASANQATIINLAGTLDASGITGVSPSLTIGSLSDTSGSHGAITLGNTALSLGGNNSNNSLFGIISGNGSLSKLGSGTLTLNGQNNYSGGTSVQAGSLVVDSNGQLGSGVTNISPSAILSFIHNANAQALAITNGGSLSFNNSATASTASITNNQTLNFNDTSSAHQATITNQGIINFANSASANTANITNTINHLLHFNGTSTSNQASVTNNGNMDFNNSATAGTATISNAQILSFNNTSTADQAQITNEGTLSFNNAANAANSIITNTGLLNFNNTSTANQSIIDNSDGTVDLSGMDSATALSLGALSDSSASHINLGSRQLILGANNANSTLYGTITDDGAGNSVLNKTGNGILLFKGANNYSGSTNILGGTLAVDSNFASLGAGPVTVGSGATLSFVNSAFTAAFGSPVYSNNLPGSGTVTINGGGMINGEGTVDSLINYGTAAPGDLSTLGTLTVTHDFTSQAGSTYHVKVDDQGNSDLLSIGDTAQINGGTVYLSLLNGTYQTNTPYTILTAGTLSGAFDTFIQPIALNGELHYDYNQGKITYQFSSLVVNLADAVSTPNQISVANYLLAIDVPPSISSTLTGLITNQQLETYFDQLSAATYADQQLALAQIGNWFDSHMRDHIQKQPDAQQLTPWLVGRKTSDKLSSQQVGGYKDTPDEFAYGVESTDTHGLFGVGLAYTHFHGRSFDSHEHSCANGNFYQVGSYANHAIGNWLFGATASAGYLNHMHADRWIKTDSSYAKIQGNYHAALFSAQAQTIYTPIQLDNGLHLQPLLGIHYQHLNRSSFFEQGTSGAELNISGSHFNSLRSQLGFAAHTDLHNNMQPFIQGIWEHEFADTVSGFDASFEGAGGSFHVDSVEMGRAAYIAKAGLALSPQPHWDALVFYEGRFARHLRENAAKLQLEYKF